MATPAKIDDVVILDAVQEGAVWSLRTNRGDYQTKPGALVNNLIEDLGSNNLGGTPHLIANPDHPVVTLLIDKETELVWGVQYRGRPIYPNDDKVHLSMPPDCPLVRLVQRWEDLRRERAQADDSGEMDYSALRSFEDAQLELASQITDQIFDWFEEEGLVH